MSKRLQGMVVGLLIGTLLTGSLAIAKSSKEKIEVTYDNIKVYKDNVLCETKDANGTVVEPFIYNGTTYMPVRGTANLAGMDVTWDGKTKSVYLWDELTAEDTVLVDVMPPYETGYHVSVYSSAKGQSFEMAGKKYSNGLSTDYDDDYALFNLDSKYSTLTCTVGHTGNNTKEKTLYFIVDGKTVKTVELQPDCMPKDISVPLNYGLQLKVLVDGYAYEVNIGIANMIVK